MKLRISACAAFALSLLFCCVVMWSDCFFGRAEETVAEEKSLPVIIIDPGHGGMDGGASAADGTAEKDINLQIGLKLQEIMMQYPVEVIMTRTDDSALAGGEGSIKSMKRQDLKNRKKLIDESNPVIAVSIHLNSFPEDASVYGAQVFYPKESIKRTDGLADEQGAKAFAENIQKSLENNISDGRERAAMTKNDIILFRNPTCPMVLVECGFLSNPDEAQKLKTPEYQEELASAIWQGINENLCLEKLEKTEIIDSEKKNK